MLEVEPVSLIECIASWGIPTSTVLIANNQEENNKTI